MNFRTYFTTVIAVLTLGAFAQIVHSHQHSAPAVKSPTKMSMQMMDMKKCMADMAAGQARLDFLVATMNSASGAEKSDATTAVVAEMAKQQKAMGEMCMMMMKQMGDMPMMNAPAKHGKVIIKKTSGHESHHN